MHREGLRAELSQHRGRLSELLLRAPALLREQYPAAFHQRQRKPSELPESSHCTCRHCRHLETTVQLLSANLMKRHVVEIELLHDLRQPCDPAFHRLDQVHVEIRAHQCQDDSRQARTRSHIGQ